MALEVETGTGSSSSNSYVDPTGAAALDYLAGRLYSDAWDNATSPNREKAVRMATQTLDKGVAWYGFRTRDAQALAWPREGMARECVAIPSNEVPREIVSATMELAIALLARNRTDTDGGTAEVQRLALGEGALELTFSAGTDPASKAVPVLPDSVWRIVSIFGERVGAGFNQARVRR